MDADQNSLVENAAGMSEDGVATETISDLDHYEPSPAMVEELGRRIATVEAGDVMPFQDYVEKVHERRQKLDD